MSQSAPQLAEGIGDRVRIYREAAGLTQVSLAESIGRSSPWLSQIERGVSGIDRLTDIVAIAQACRCRVTDILGGPLDALTPAPTPRGEQVAAVRRAIMRTALPIGSATRTPLVSLPAVADRVAQAWQTWHSSPTAHHAVGRVLPDLIADAHAAYLAADDRRAAARPLAGTWHIARNWLHHLPEAELAWVAAERSVAAAQEADDPRLLALGAWAMSASYRRAGQQEEATRVCLTAADEVQRQLATTPSDDLLAAYGILNLAAAISAAQSDESGKAWALHRAAEEAARAVSGGYDPWTMFGAGNVDIHGLALAAELGDHDAVVDRISRLDIDRVPSVERRSRPLIDAARGYVRRKEDLAAVLALLDAEKISADEVHDSGLVRELVRELLVRDHARARPHVRALARRCHLLID
ncbi:helix-turn-helix transcriptional regulator [Nocardia puris]|uniref:Transcriptional regulator with XRE-family HTH domain n=1 Tax=Nocardia puris TaxID=208602 RepID=A0A366D5I9_9NOCA|nr:helix-turn-helix transcriptional regulator [Nocardia puris]MBF6215888.1 helix-turn-helix transcriptional regulator [Nocardia puris]RBO85225.1 transcriptional regulator with XRE-family HTH domain [Nocardia puris]